jgi:hypothetical protein
MESKEERNPHGDLSIIYQQREKFEQEKAAQKV